MDSSKKQDILHACLAEFAEYGYERANTNRICEAAEVSKGLIFHYFGSKQKLFMLAVEKCINDILAYFNVFSVDDQDFLSAMLKYSEQKMKFFMENPLHYKMLMQAFYNAPNELKPEIDQKRREVYDIGENIILELLTRLPLKDGVNREQALSLIMAVSNIIEGKYISTLSNQDGFSTEQYKAVEKEYIELMKLVLYGIADERAI
ncbi:hypothetical protein SY88_20910 [Clostridiales bacterium PH28_bin88]|nr:hypothetical protein SY88_20910 [Clostridiales bacterium PH28_bin88]